jgi:hypothetical protein
MHRWVSEIIVDLATGMEGSESQVLLEGEPD